MNSDNNGTLNILLADDDADDRMLFGDAVETLQVKANLITVKDGVKLMQHLLDQESVLPQILFLDLNMPSKNGFECLDEIRTDSRLKNIFITIYSTTANPREIEEAFLKGANIFTQKPNTFTELKLTLAKIFALDLKQYLRPDRTKFVLNKHF